MPQLNPGSWQLGLQRARLTLHESDPITGNEDLLSSLFYEFYRGYTAYSTARGRGSHSRHAGLPQAVGEVRLLLRRRGGQDLHQAPAPGGLYLG